MTTRIAKLELEDEGTLVCKWSESDPAAPVKYAFERIASISNWMTSPFQSHQVKKSTACKMILDWLDESEA